MKLDNLTRLKHMYSSAKKTLDFLNTKKRVDLDNDEMLLLAILKLIETIGEAASNISPEIILNHPEIPWQQIIGVRNRLIHGYFDINKDILWKITEEDLPLLINNLNKLITNFEN